MATDPDVRLPRAGDVLHVGKAASVQFMAPMLFRVIRVHDWETYWGWIWLDGYELNSCGDAIERRSIFVQLAGLYQVGKAPDPRRRSRAPLAKRPAERITHTVTRRMPCTGCGKNLARTRTFSQLADNPFDRKPDGSVKDHADIRQELAAKAAAWTPDATCGPCRDIRNTGPVIPRPRTSPETTTGSPR